MRFPFIRGRVAKQAHVGLPEGTVEEEYARNGFFGNTTHFYRTAPPVNWSRIEGKLRPHAYDFSKVAIRSEDYIAARTFLLENEDVRLGFVRLTQPMPYLFRNADGDEVIFVHEGRGQLQTDFGPFAYEPGDYLLIPRGTAHRFLPTEPSAFLIIVAFSEVGFPDRGMLGEHAQFDPAVINVPSPDEAMPFSAGPTGEWELVIERQGELTRVFYPHNPLNVVGWKGTLAPMQLNVRDIRPVVSDRYHLPPSAHTTFIMRNAVICSFLPRPLENGDPTALRVPFYHSNIDFDEVLFYHDGEFFSRKGIGPGMATFHPQGIHHGPQPGAVQRTAGVKETKEVAVMLDVKRPLRATAAAGSVENLDYWKSWQG